MERLRLCGVGCLFILALGMGPAAAEPLWPSGPYSYVVVDQDLRDVLQQLGANTGIKFALSDKVQGRVHGPLPSAPPKQFLDNLAQQFGLEWVYDGAIVSVSAASEAKTEIIPLGEVDPAKLRAGLSGAGLLDARYQFKPVLDGHAVLVSGPPRYLSLVHDALAATPPEKAPPPPAAVSQIQPKPQTVTVMRGSSSSVIEFKR